SAVNRCARLRNVAHGGQTVLSQATHDLVLDRLPDGSWLADLGTHRLRDLARPEHVHQLCHPDLQAEFPPLASLDAFAHNLPVQLTSFVGRQAEMAEITGLLRDARLVTLTGSGGAGKTRLAMQVAADTLGEHPDGVWQVDLAPVADADLVATVVARALALEDEPLRSATETISYHVGAKTVLIVLDNCEHVIDVCAALVETLLRSCPSLAILATSREPLGVEGEIAWRVPSLTLPSEEGPTPIQAVTASEAAQLFVERARRARPGFELNGANANAVSEICRRLDGIPLAIELAAARVRAFAPERIVTGLHDRFHLLAGGARTAVPRQQTLRASVDWSHDLLTEPERVLFRRLGVFAGSCDFDAVEAVGAGDGLEDHQVLDQLALLVDKSLVVAEEVAGETRYRLLETVRQYALERLDESGEADAVRRRHRDYYLAFVQAASERVISHEQDRWLDRLEDELDNLRAAFAWNMDRGDSEPALCLASSLFYLWMMRGYWLEGRSWLDSALAAAGHADPAVRLEALIVSTQLEARMFSLRMFAQAPEALRLARDLGDPRLLIRALNAASVVSVLGGQPVTGPREAVDLARAVGEPWALADALGWEGCYQGLLGDLAAGRALAEEGLALARDVGDRFTARANACWLIFMLFMQGDLDRARSVMGEMVPEARAAGERGFLQLALSFGSLVAALTGDADAARSEADQSVAISRDVGMTTWEAFGHGALGYGALAAGRGQGLEAREAFRKAWELLMGGLTPWGAMCLAGLAVAELAQGDVAAAREHADAAIARTDLQYARVWALGTRARVAVADDDIEYADDLAHRALAAACDMGARALVADSLELLAAIAAGLESYAEAARLLGAGDALRGAIGAVRFETDRSWYAASVAAVRAALGDQVFEIDWCAGTALSLDEAVAYASRGRGERKRPATGWASLTPSELEVARLVGEGLANKDVAERLFVSPRTVQSHLTHIYTKLDVTSRVQLAKEATRRS
ncbi:MAG: helix-turn-helix transcriptional regulator, partial [Acidimicrobiales bacterium]